jgi:Cu/Ag efflux pump CusA
LVSALAIALSLLAAALVLSLLGATINAMVLAGLVAALVVIVDDAIVDVERILRRLREQRESNSAVPVGAVVVQAVAETRASTLYATMIIALAILPAFFVTGLVKAFLDQLAASYLLALLASFVVAVTATPAMASVLLGDVPVRRGHPLSWLRRRYEAVLSTVVDATRTTMLAAVAVVLVALAIWPLFGQSLLPSFRMLPQFSERDVRVTWKGALGTSYPETYRVITLLSRELESIPGVRNVSAHVGRAVTGDQIVGVESGQLWVSIDPAADYKATLAAIKSAVDGYPGAEHNVQTYLQETVREVFSGTGDALAVRVRGPDWDGLRREAAKVKEAISGVSGLVDLKISGQIEEPQVEVEVNIAEAGKYGLTPGDIRRAAATNFAGLEVGSLFEQQKVFEVVVWSLPAKRDSLTDLGELLIDTPTGDHVRLGDVAEVRVVPTLSVIEREGISRYVDVVADVRGRDVSAVADDVAKRLQTITFPSEYYPVLLAESVEVQKSQRLMLIAALGALLGIFFLLQACFRSWQLALAIFLTLPLALVGAVVAIHATGNVVLLGSLIGCVAVFAITIRHCLQLIRYCQSLELRKGEGFGPEPVRRGASDQFAPIVMTMVASAVALLPLVYQGPIAGLEIVQPMAVIILCGLVTSTVFNLFVVPSLYWSFGRNPEPELQFEPGH